MKKTVILLSVLLIVSLIIFKNMRKEDKLFYFIGSELFAVCEDGKLRPIKDEFGTQKEKITYDELFSQDYFIEYLLEKDINNKLDNIKLAVFESGELTNENDNIIKSLLNNSKKNGVGETYLSEQKYDIYDLQLPKKVSREIASKDAYRAIGENGYGYWLELSKNNTLVTNLKSKLEFEQKSEDIELSDNVIETIEKYIENNKISRDLEYFCTSKFVTDLNNDDEFEKLYVIETYHIDRDDKSFEYHNNKSVMNTGAFTLILIEYMNGEVQILLESKILPLNQLSGEYTRFFEDNVLGYVEQPNIYITDLDRDKEKELIIDATGVELEGGDFIKLYDNVENRYIEIATSYYGYGL